MTGRRQAATRSAAIGLAGWGLLLLARPDGVARAVSPVSPEPRTWVIRLLGARMLLQHGLVAASPVRPLVLASATVDGIHALSMLVMAATMPRFRRVTLVSAGVAGAAALAGTAATPEGWSGTTEGPATTSSAPPA